MPLPVVVQASEGTHRKQLYHTRSVMERFGVTRRIHLTFLNLLDIVLEAVEATTEQIVFEVQLGWQSVLSSGLSQRSSRTMVKPVKTSLAKLDILRGASKSPRVTAFTTKRDCPSNSYTL
jgi:hypothetical protein